VAEIAAQWFLKTFAGRHTHIEQKRGSQSRGRKLMGSKCCASQTHAPLRKNFARTGFVATMKQMSSAYHQLLDAHSAPAEIKKAGDAILFLFRPRLWLHENNRLTPASGESFISANSAGRPVFAQPVPATTQTSFLPDESAQATTTSAPALSPKPRPPRSTNYASARSSASKCPHLASSKRTSCSVSAALTRS